METVVISHSSDIDGVGSASLIRRKYGVPLGNLFFTNYIKENLEYVQRKLKRFYPKGVTLFITDLGVNERIAGNFLEIIKGVKRNGGRVVWLDHHPWTDESLSRLAKACDAAVVGENPRYCATEITAKELGMNDRFTNRFVRIVHYSDFNKKPKDKLDREMVKRYALSIASYEMNPSRDYVHKKLRHIVRVISSGRLSDNAIRKDSERFEKMNVQRTREMLDELYIRKDFALGFSQDLQSTYACGEITKKSHKRLAFYINVRKGSGHLRAVSGDYSALARELGGGGHPRAAGFFVDLKRYNNFRTRADKERFADFLQRKVSET